MNTTSKNTYVAPVSQIVIPDGIQGLIKSVSRACLKLNFQCADEQTQIYFLLVGYPSLIIP